MNTAAPGSKNRHGVYEPTEVLALPVDRKGWRGMPLAEIRLLHTAEGWRAVYGFQVEGCGGICQSFPRVPGRVLDPFGGAGTVGTVAEQLGLDSTLIELNPEYAEMARRRIYGEAPAEDEAA